MAPVPGSFEQTMPEMDTYWTLEKSANTPVPASSVTFEDKDFKCAVVVWQESSGCFHLLRWPTVSWLEQVLMPSSVMEKLNLRTGGSTVQSGVPPHSCLECSELRESRLSLYPLKYMGQSRISRSTVWEPQKTWMSEFSAQSEDKTRISSEGLDTDFTHHTGLTPNPSSLPLTLPLGFKCSH